MDLASAELDGRWVELSDARTPAGDRIVLRCRAGQFEIRFNGWELMSNRSHHSEDALAALACEHLNVPAPRVLVGGLGMGYTLRALLDGLSAAAHVTVAELLPEVADWNRGPLSHLASHPLEDARVTVLCRDVSGVLRTSPGSYDAIVLDVDNGPDAVTFSANRQLYARDGLRLMRRALKPAGVLAVWSASHSRRFEDTLAAAGFRWRGVEIPARGSPGDPMHVIYLATQHGVSARANDDAPSDAACIAKRRLTRRQSPARPRGPDR